MEDHMLTRFTLIAALALISTPALAQLDYQTGGAADQAFHDNYVHNFGEPPPSAVNGYNWAAQQQMEDAWQRPTYDYRPLGPAFGNQE
jgi:hypothetical protein